MYRSLPCPQCSAGVRGAADVLCNTLTHINTLIPRTPYHKAVFMGPNILFMSAYLCHHYPQLHRYLPPLEKHPHFVRRSQLSRRPGPIRLTHSVFLFLLDVPLQVSMSPRTSDSWPRSPLSLNTEHSENNGNDISSFLSGSNRNDQLQVACSPVHPPYYAPPCPQNYRVIRWKM